MYKYMTKHGEITFESIPQLAEDFAAAIMQIKELIKATKAIDKLKNVPKLDPDELWDEFSKYIDDDLFSLQEIAGTSVITEELFHDLMVKLNLAKP